MKKILIPICAILLFAQGCKQETISKELPFLGRTTEINGEKKNHTIPAFAFVNQDSIIINNESLQDYIYITDFFFTSCPSICPKVMKQMLRLYDKYKDDDRVKFVSYTIDPKRDTQAQLKLYANNLGVDHNKWYFLTGDKDALLDMADDYFIVAYEDADSPGGFDHSGKIILVDKKGHVRAFCEGTEEESVDGFFPQVDQLLATYDQ